MKIDTGAGNDVFVMSGMVGRNEYTKNDFLVVDLGANGNLLSIGATLNIGGKRGSLSSITTTIIITTTTNTTTITTTIIIYY